MSESTKSNVAANPQNLEDFRLERCRSWYYTSSKSTVYRLTRYRGSNPDVVVPECVVAIDTSAFEKQKIHSLTLPSKMFLSNLPKLSQMDSLTQLVSTNPDGESADMVTLCSRFPALEILEFRNTCHLYLENMSKLSKTGRHFEIRVPSTEVERIVLGYYKCDFNPDITLFAPYLTPGLIEAPLRLNAIETFLSHPDWYPEESYNSYKKWLQKNSDKLLTICNEYNYEKLFLKCLATEGLRLPAKAYDRIIQAAEKSQDQELKASALFQKGKYYDLDKLAQREETLSLNDMEDPLRNHAMKQLWSWGKQEDDTLVIRKYKAGNSSSVPDNADDIEIPSVITGKPVTALSGSVFKEMKIQKVLVPESITEFSGNIFTGSTVKEVIFEGSPRGIPDKCFASCGNLSSIRCFENSLVISDSGIDIPPAFELSPAQLLVIGKNAFEHTSIRHILIQNAVLCQNAFHGSALQSVALRNVLVIPDKCFSDCDALVTIDIQGSVLIESQAFEYCASLTDIHVSDSLFSVAPLAFDNCRRIQRIHLHHVRFPDKIKKVFPQYIRDHVEFILEN